MLSTYDVHVPSAVLGEITTPAIEEDFLGTAAGLVSSASEWVTEHEIEDRIGDSVDYGLDVGESHCNTLANDPGAEC